MVKKQADKAALAASMDADAEPDSDIAEAGEEFQAKVVVALPPKMPNQFELSTSIVNFLHDTYPQARHQDWTLFVNALFLAQRELKRTWAGRKAAKR